MADIVDQAENHHDEVLAMALAANAKALKVDAPNGQCHFCAEPVGPGMRYCDTDCRDMAERLRAARVRNGG